jgi:mRNA interferase MazF
MSLPSPTSSPSFPKVGEVFWVNIPNQPNDPHQPRTAIVISPNGRNKSCNDIMVIPTTSSAKFKQHPLVHVSIPAGEGGLKSDSIARCDQVTTVDKSLLGSGPLGAPIGNTYQDQLIKGVRRAIADPTV